MKRYNVINMQEDEHVERDCYGDWVRWEDVEHLVCQKNACQQVMAEQEAKIAELQNSEYRWVDLCSQNAIAYTREKHTLTTQAAELGEAIAEMTKKYNEYFNLHHTLRVNEAGMRNTCCDALGIEPYQHELYDLIQMLVAKRVGLEEENLDDLVYLWDVINSPAKAGSKWCQYSRESINESIVRLKRLMIAQGVEFRPLAGSKV